MNGSTEEKLFVICNYSHDGDFAVFEEKCCECTLYRRGDNYFIRRSFKESWDYEVVRSFYEDIPVNPEDFDKGQKSFSAKYCNGQADNNWISTYNIHKDADKDTGVTIREMLEAHK